MVLDDVSCKQYIDWSNSICVMLIKSKYMVKHNLI